VSKYVRNIRLETEFDGDHVVIVMRPLKFADLVILSTKIQEGEAALINEFVGMMKKYIISIEGLNDAEGGAIGIDDLGDSYFAPVTAQAAVKCINASAPPTPPKPVEQPEG
jgi:hypothetical protein